MVLVKARACPGQAEAPGLLGNFDFWLVLGGGGAPTYGSRPQLQNQGGSFAEQKGESTRSWYVCSGHLLADDANSLDKVATNCL